MKGSFFVSESKNNKLNNKKMNNHLSKEIHNEKFDPPADISVKYSVCNPDSCEEQVNVYGTYEIQPTANTENDFPAIAQGATPDMEKRSKEFFRGGADPKPASEWSDEDCID